jgi:hypothetical protein
MARSTQKSSAQAADADGYELALADYQTELAQYLQVRIKPGLNAGATALLARSIAREIAAQEPPQAPNDGKATTDRDTPTEDEAHGRDLEAHMHDLQAELGPDWIVCVSVHGQDGWLTAEKQDASQHVEASNAEGLVRIVHAINENAAR